MAIAEFYAAWYMIIENEKWEVLFMKRVNTWFRDGTYQVPAGHLEQEESMIDCVIRETKEELDIDILEKDCEVVHISHRVSKDRVYFDFYVKVKKYSWELKINEPHKCSELKFIDLDNIQESEKYLFSYDLGIIKDVRKWWKFSDIVL